MAHLAGWIEAVYRAQLLCPGGLTRKKNPPHLGPTLRAAIKAAKGRGLGGGGHISVTVGSGLGSLFGSALGLTRGLGLWGEFQVGPSSRGHGGGCTRGDDDGF